MRNDGSGIAYTYGIDPQGKMYIYDLWSKKMIHYGDVDRGADRVVMLQQSGAKMNFEGDKTNGGYKNMSTATTADASQAQGLNVVGGGTGAGGGYAAPAKVLDQAQIDALSVLLGNLDNDRSVMHRKAALRRDEQKTTKSREREKEESKYKGKKLSTLQDFGTAKTETDINTRNTLENLVSSLSTMGLGGGRALQRQVLAAANMSNRKANATQAQNNQGLDTAWNEYESGYKDDLTKIDDQYKYEVGEADRTWGKERQNTLYKMADVYNAGGRNGDRQRLMGEANNLGSFISNAAFVNPGYTGQSRAMAAPELADYTQDIAQYNTAGIGTDGSVTPVGDTGAPGNLAVRAIAVNDRDLGIKKKTEGDIAYGV